MPASPGTAASTAVYVCQIESYRSWAAATWPAARYSSRSEHEPRLPDSDIGENAVG